MHLVARQDADVVHAHLAGDVGQNLVAVVELDPEHGVREGLYNRSLENDCVFLGLWQGTILLRMYDSPGRDLRTKKAAHRWPTGHTTA